MRERFGTLPRQSAKDKPLTYARIIYYSFKIGSRSIR